MEISQERYDELVKAEAMLNMLKEEGIEDWKWYDEALDSYHIWEQHYEMEKPL